MTTAISACPACIAAPAAERLASVPDAPAGPARLVLSLPTAHCAACISDVERALLAHPGVSAARVNLSLRRVAVEAAPAVTAPELVTVLAGIGYEAHELDPDALRMTETDRRGRDLLMRIGIAGFAMMNIMLLSVAVWSGAEDATRDMFHWISAAIALPTVAFAGQPFFAGALAALKARRLGMDVPISLGLILASAMSLFETINHGHHVFFDGAVMLSFFLLTGRYLEYRSRAAARSAAEELAALEVPRAHLLRDGAEVEVPIADLRPGDLVRVRPGQRMPCDGRVATGASELDRSLLTGETLPVAVAPGAVVSAGEVNLTGPLEVSVTAAGRDSSLNRMAGLVAIAESARNRYTSLADRMARGYAPVVHILSAGAFAGWLWISGGDVRLALNVAVAVLIITCPCALALAVPAVVTAASGRLFRRGLLIKNPTALERLAEIDTVVFDKTGTLTLGTPEPEGFAALPLATRQVAAALAGASSHPLARAIAQAAEGLEPVAVEDLREVAGQGVEGRIGDSRLRLGRAEWLGVAPGARTATWLRIGAAAPVEIAFTDRLRPGAAEAVAGLKAQGKRVELVSGDVAPAVAALAAKLGIADWLAGQRPEDKAAHLQALASAGARVLMVGDGLNDTAALAAAHASISPASALDAARAASDIVLLGTDLAPVEQAVKTAVVARARIKQNFAISLGYNAIAVPLALVGMATPLAAAVAMSLSSLSVSLNALRLR
ncbi:heavy metal translocating P-type ATPase [Frigidibacter sp. MR17.14]|uniref:heavy metal translocating P-type ATPase n=1 Tax=Frigidibacter sp. MR17.14 TaxID=3126509 RepID=UPI003012F35C